MKGKLYLIPSTLGEAAPHNSLPMENLEIVSKLRVFIVEDLRTARRFLRKFIPEMVIDDLAFFELNEHTRAGDIAALLQPLEDGSDAGLLSEAGMPCVADPGAMLVALAHEAGITVKPLAGPSSIFLALAASGFNGQNFAFVGYLPVDKKERSMRVRELETLAYSQDQTQVFIETPYRNEQLLQTLLQVLKPSTKLCVAVNLTQPDEWIRSMGVNDWKHRGLPDLRKKPAVFLLYK